MLALVPWTTGCGACTAIGCSSGIYIDRPVDVAGADRFTIEMCIDDQCATAAGRPWSPKNISGTGAHVGPGAFTAFVDDGEMSLEWYPQDGVDLSGERWRVSLTMTSRGREVLAEAHEVEFTPSWPNGKRCDGDPCWQADFGPTPT